MILAEKQQERAVSRKCRLFMAASVSLVLAATLTKIAVSNRSVTWGQDLEALKNETEKIRQENQRLKNELTKKTGGLALISEEAVNRGFTDKPKIKYFNHEWQLALKTD